MEMNEKRPESMHPFVDIDGFIADGKQFDLDITLANDHRDVIYGIIRDCFKEPVKEAVVKLVKKANLRGGNDNISIAYLKKESGES